ncbi:signal peptide peptidase SppA [Microlunatus elymi]|uniref:Signal peptide peptidase SppA n=1 Tax=Microlunatus elymi TaxID=2596828 RepID=A0A516PWT9_9ACTN|nr:signal peptide peptidase SppA [Microlunatus elymi]QDP95602.1 signal peptide peptidase SppA [Microlunatus elymi]
MEKKPLVLEIDLSLGLQDATPQDPLTALRARNTPRLSHIISGLRHAAGDDEVVALIMHLTPMIKAAEADELAIALRSFRDAGKKVIAWSESFGELGPGTLPYYLATVADEIWMQPSGTLGLQGIGLEVATIRGVLDKIGAEPQIGQRQEYKTAAEMYTATEISEPNREMTGRMCASITEQVINATAQARLLTPEQVAEAMSVAPLAAEDALQRNLIDHLGYRDDVYRSVRDSYGGRDDDEQEEPQLRLLFAHRYARSLPKQAVSMAKRRRSPIIAVVNVNGAIVTGRGHGQLPTQRPQAGSDLVAAALRSAADNDSVRAVVLRVDSPGGSYVASDAIRDAVLRVKKSGRPVIVSMGALAASGGYFVSMAADRIVALPSTLTGSIGVLGGKVVIKETLTKIGVTREAIGSRSATMFSSDRRFADDEWARVEGWLDAVYEDFTQKAADDRGLDYADLEAVARGRVWTGADAKERGLVDELGGLRTAVELACRRVGTDVDHVRVQQFPQLPMLARFKPAESTESLADAVISGPPPGLLETLTTALGVQQAGVLSLPWRFRFS